MNVEYMNVEYMNVAFLNRACGGVAPLLEP